MHDNKRNVKILSGFKRTLGALVCFFLALTMFLTDIFQVRWRYRWIFGKKKLCSFIVDWSFHQINIVHVYARSVKDFVLFLQATELQGQNNSRFDTKMI